MTCIIADDEPLAREALELLIQDTQDLCLLGSFGSATAAAAFMLDHAVDLILLDIQMPGISGLEFAKSIPKRTLVIFCSAYGEFALDSYDVEALDYLLKPIRLQRFHRSIEKAQALLPLLKTNFSANQIESVGDDYFFVKADRKIIKVFFSQILFVQGMKDYVILQTSTRKIITAMNVKTIYEQLPKNVFARVSKSYVINVNHIDSIDNNSAVIGTSEIPIGQVYRDAFFEEFVSKRIIER